MTTPVTRTMTLNLTLTFEPKAGWTADDWFDVVLDSLRDDLENFDNSDPNAPLLIQATLNPA